MSARRTATRTAVATLTATAFLTPAASASAAPGQSRSGSYDAGSCGRLDTQIRPTGNLKLKVGKPGRLTIAFVTQRPCTMNVGLRACGRDDNTGGLFVGPSNFTPVAMPGTFTWTVTGTKKADGFLAAGLSGAGTSFGIRLNDVTVRQTTAGGTPSSSTPNPPTRGPTQPCPHAPASASPSAP